jgi:hypothetical protein
MSHDIYNVIFSSRGTNNLGVGNLNNITYIVNWVNILPKNKYKKFLCNFLFKSENFAGELTDNGYLNINFGKVNCFDGISNTNNIGIIFPISYVPDSSCYHCTNNDNYSFTCDYPTSNSVVVTLNNFAGAAMGNMEHYVLIINFQGIE